MFFFFFFFFSSRRRHTRYWRDWSSDVCSSDLPPTSLRIAGEKVEQLARVHAKVRTSSEEAQIGIYPGGRCIVVAGGQMHVAPDAVVLPPDHKRCLAVGLETYDAIDHVDTGMLEGARPDDIVLFVIARL